MGNAATSGRGVNGAQRAGGRSVPVAMTAFLVLVAVLVSVAVAQEVDQRRHGDAGHQQAEAYGVPQPAGDERGIAQRHQQGHRSVAARLGQRPLQ